MSENHTLRSGFAHVLLAACVLLVGSCDGHDSLTSRLARDVTERIAPPAPEPAKERPVSEHRALPSTARSVPPPTAPPAPTAETSAAAPNDAPSQESVYYHYVDASGSLRFVRDRSLIPKGARTTAQRVAVKNESTAPPPNALTKTESAQKTRPWQAAYEAPWEGRAQQVVVYSAPWCGWCRKTITYLKSRDVRYTEKDIEANPAYHRELVSKTGRTSIPVIDVDGELIRGYNRAEIDRRLGL